MKPNWQHKFPTKAGEYWFAGERYKRNDFCKELGHLPDYEIMLCKVRKISNGMLVVANGQFMGESELGDEWFFAPATLPAMPAFKKPGKVRD